MKARENPFRSERVLAIQYQFQNDTTWDGLHRRLAEINYRAAIVGPEGSGKTTLQEELDRRLQGQNSTTRWLRLNRENRQDAKRLIKDFLESSSTDEILFVDGTEQIGPITWRKFLRQTSDYRGLIITTHKPGRLTTLIECSTTLDLLKSIVAELIPDSLPNLEISIEEIFAHHEGNLRLCLRELYNQFSA